MERSDSPFDPRVTPARCMSCGEFLDAATCVSGEGEVKPNPGDATICMLCNAIQIYNDDLSLRSLTDDERKRMQQENPKHFALLLKAQAHLIALKATDPKWKAVNPVRRDPNA